jgi:hypothetical protein
MPDSEVPDFEVHRPKRFPLSRLAAAMGIVVGPPSVKSADGHPIGHGAIAERLGIDVRTVRRYQRDGIPEDSADKYACMIGKMPDAVWPWWYRCGDPQCTVCPRVEVE